MSYESLNKICVYFQKQVYNVPRRITQPLCVCVCVHKKFSQVSLYLIQFLHDQLLNEFAAISQKATTEKRKTKNKPDSDKGLSFIVLYKTNSLIFSRNEIFKTFFCSCLLILSKLLLFLAKHGLIYIKRIYKEILAQFSEG